MKCAMAAALLILAAAEAPAQRQRSVNPPAQTSDWKIEITTSGGFTGSGNGGLTVSSDGTLVITPMAAPPATKGCTFRLTSGELRAVDSAVRSSTPGAWMECFSPADQSRHCCDLIQTHFSLTENGGRNVFVTSWLTGNDLPADLRSLVDLLRGPAGIDTRYRPLCTPTP